MCISIFYAQVMGLWLFIVSLAMLMHHGRFKKVFTESMSNQTHMAFSGLVSLVLGLLVVLSHNIWVPNWPVVVTIIGWVLIIQAVARLFWPESFGKMMKDIAAKNHTAWCWFWLIVGLYLTWYGFWG